MKERRLTSIACANGDKRTYQEREERLCAG